MSYHIITIDSPEAYITCRKGQLICDSKDGEPKQIALEDVAAIVITSFSASVHSAVLTRAAELGVSIIFCKNFKPEAILMPANRASDTLLTKAFVELNEVQMEKYWQKTIEAKCDNQLKIAKMICGKSLKIESLESVAKRITAKKESQCARYYWQIFAEAIGKKSFRRNSENFAENALLDFSYTMLGAIVMQKIFAFGLDASYGIGHSIRERSAPLVYDLMEQFRPYIDLGVYKWIMENEIFGELEVCTDFKRFILKFMQGRVEYKGRKEVFMNVIEEVIRSFRNAIKTRDISKYEIWTLKNSKWVG